MSIELPLCWEKFLKEGDALFEYMTHNFESMFDGVNIKDFTIVDGIAGGACAKIDRREIEKEYNDDIQKELILWIKKEYEEGRLFQKELWKPFRDTYRITTMFLGYKKMFQYKHYYTQLRLMPSCQIYLDDCEYCKKSFCLAVYGWKDDKTNTLQPYTYIPIPDSETMLMPENIWRRM